MINYLNLLKSVATGLLIILAFQISAFAQEHQEKRTLSSFSEMKIGGAFEVILIPSNEEYVEITTKGVESSQIITEVKSNSLLLDLEKNTINRRYMDEVEIKAKVYYKSLSSLNITGAVKISSQSVIKTPSFYLRVGGAGDIELALDTKELTVVNAGAANLKVSGRADKQVIQLDGAGNIQAFDLKSKRSEVRLNGMGNVEVYASEEIDAEMNGMGNIEYKGNPSKAQIKKNGLGSIESRK